MYWFKDISVLSGIQSLLSIGYTWDQILWRIDKEFDYDFRTSENVRKRFGENRFRIRGLEKPLVDLQYLSFDEAYDQYCKYIGKTIKVKPFSGKKNKDKKLSKKLLISDLHIPFHNKVVLEETIYKHKDADELIIGGDFWDCYSVSRFAKKQYVPLREEITQGAAILAWLSSQFEKITIIKGNHSMRLWKYFEKRIDQELMFLTQYDLFSLAAKDLKNVKIVNDVYQFPHGKGKGEIGHFAKFGDCVVGHFEMSSKIPARSAINAYTWLNNWGNYFGTKDIKLYLQGHTHRLSKIPLNDGVVTVGETGCMCQVQEYAIEPSGKYTAALNGYWVLYFNGDKVDVNRSNFYIC